MKFIIQREGNIRSSTAQTRQEFRTMLIPVIYPDGRHDLVKGFTLSQLIVNRDIVKFKRRHGWVDVNRDELRKSYKRSVYFGRERRSEEDLNSNRQAAI